MDLNENDLRKLFQAAGHQVPTEGLTDRIMARVSVTRIVRLDLAEPLISKRAWILIGIGLVTLCTMLGLMPGASTQPTGPTSSLVSLIGAFVPRIHLPQGSWPLWSVFALGSVLFFVWVDNAITRGTRRTTA